MIADGSPQEKALLNQLPTRAQLLLNPAPGVTVSNNIVLNRANLKALRGTPTRNVPSAINPGVTAIDGTVNFNNQANLFDFDRTDGLTPGLQDFLQVALHEIGHALGFVSAVDAVDGGTLNVSLNTLDLFRLAPGAAVPDHNPLNPKYRLFIAAWKRLPLPLANLLGPPIVRGIG